MTGEQIGIACTVVLTLLGLVGLLVTVRERSTKQAEAEQERLATAYRKGRESRNDEVALLRSERDDARHERDLTQTRCDEFERRYYDLRDRG